LRIVLLPESMLLAEQEHRNSHTSRLPHNNTVEHDARRTRARRLAQRCNLGPGSDLAIFLQQKMAVGAGLRYLRLPETQKRFEAEGAETDFRTPEEVRKMLPIETAKWANVAKVANIRGQ
jgi:hypothetical protein